MRNEIQSVQLDEESSFLLILLSLLYFIKGCTNSLFFLTAAFNMTHHYTRRNSFINKTYDREIRIILSLYHLY